MPDCQCNTSEMTALILPSESFQLCHHSPPEDLLQARNRYEELLSRLAAGLDPYLMTEASLAEASSHYASQRLSPQQRNLMNEFERNIVHAAFLRTRAAMTTYLMLDKLHQTALILRSSQAAPEEPLP